MAINHPKFSNLKSSVADPQEVEPARVHTVMPIDDDMIFAKQMESVMSQASMSQAEPIHVDDTILKKEMEKKRVLEKLIMFSRPVTKQVSIDGMDFTLKLLNPDDNVKVFRELKVLTSDEQIVKTPVMLLAAAIQDINGIKISEVFSGPAEITDPLLQTYHEINKWPVSLINAISSAFQEFVEETEKGFTKDFLKK